MRLSCIFNASFCIRRGIRLSFGEFEQIYPNCIYFYRVYYKKILMLEIVIWAYFMLFLTRIVFLLQMRENHLIITEQYKKSLHNKTQWWESPFHELRGINHPSCQLKQMPWCSPQLPLQDWSSQTPAAQQEGFAFCSKELLPKSHVPSWGAIGCALGSLPTATSSKVGDLNNTKWHTYELISWFNDFKLY